MDFGHYTSRAAATAAALVNALPDEGFSTVPPGIVPVDPDQAAGAPADLTALARRLRAIFAAPDEARAAEAVNALLAPLPVTPHLSRHDGKPAHLHYAPDGVDAVTRVACNTAMAVATIAGEHGHRRLCTCAADDCGTAFVDTSRNGRRRFCSAACANRAHVAAHRRRNASPPS